MAERIDGMVVEIRADASHLRQTLKDATVLGRSFGSTLTSAFEDAAINGRKLSDVVESLALTLSRTALSQALRPLQSTIGSAFSSLFGNAAGSLAQSAVSAGGILGFAKGGVISAPTLFSTANRRVGLAGEAGAEAILPLARGSDGRLGVRASGGEVRPITINFNVNAQDVQSFRRSEAQIAAMVSRAVERGARNL